MTIGGCAPYLVVLLQALPVSIEFLQTILPHLGDSSNGHEFRICASKSATELTGQ